MNNPTEGHIDYDLLARYISGNATAAEISTVEQWLQESEENRQELKALRSIWALAPDVDQPAVDVDSAWMKMKARMAVAEGVRDADQELYEERKAEEQREEKKGRVIGMGDAGKWVMRIAAVLVVGLALWFAVDIFMPQKTEMMAVVTTGEQQEVMLPDGSIVTLNSHSTLEYPVKFGEEQRDVRLTGEAFFVVAENAEKPFIVNTGNALVKVLGTEFNVSAYDTARAVNVAVIEGKVLLYKEDNKGYVADSVILQKGEKGIYSRSSAAITALESAPDEIYWMSKTLIFERTELGKVAEVLNNIFGVTIEVDNEAVRNCRLSATFRDEPVENILTVIATTFGLEVNREGNKYKISGQGC